MKIKFDDLSFPFVMDLHRIKIKAEKRNDSVALESLKTSYPELFSLSVPKLETEPSQTHQEMINIYTKIDFDKKMH